MLRGTSVNPAQTSTVSTAPASVAVPAFGALKPTPADSTRFSGDKAKKADSDGGKAKTRFEAAMKDALNPGQIAGDVIWSTIITAVMFIPFHVFTIPIIPSVVLANAIFRGLRAFAAGKSQYPNSNVRLPGFLKSKPKTDAQKASGPDADQDIA